MMIRHPLVYEIDTRAWLRELSAAAGAAITLENVPEAEIGGWQQLGFTHIWLMGVWTTGPRSRAHALQNTHLRQRYDEVLPGWGEQDVAGSPYAIAAYVAADSMGGLAGLAQFRRRLNAAGLKLILDFVPNHAGLDHPWLDSRHDLFVSGTREEAGTFEHRAAGGARRLAHGRDPYFPPWTDTAQLDYRLAATHTAMIEILQGIAGHCDGVRCDMAMLVLEDVFARTWEHFPAPPADARGEFWARAIAEVKARRRDFLFLAEAYWELSPRLLSLGFDFAYEKVVRELFLDGPGSELKTRLANKPPGELGREAHFLENHDEPRIAALLEAGRHQAAAWLTLGLPGMRMLFHGQLTGARIHSPIQLARRPGEPVDREICDLYKSILQALRQSAVGHGEAAIVDATGPGDALAIQWRGEGGEIDFVVINPAAGRARVRLPLNRPEFRGRRWQLRDLVENRVIQSGRIGAEDTADHCEVESPGAGGRLLRLEPAR